MASDIITKEDLTAAESLINFIDSCPSMFHTAMTLSERLKQAGYVYLPEGSAWTIERGGSYYTWVHGSHRQLPRSPALPPPIIFNSLRPMAIPLRSRLSLWASSRDRKAICVLM